MKILALYDTMDLPETKLISGVADAGHEVCVGYNPDGIYHRQLSPQICERFTLRCRSRIDFPAVRLIKERIVAKEFDVVHAFTGRTLAATLFATIGRSASPVILSYRGALGNVCRFDPSSWISFRHPKVKGIFCVSNAVRENLLKSGFAESKLQHIYKGHDPKWYQRSEGLTRSDLGLPETAFLVCCIANMRENKGIDDFLAAAKECEDRSEIGFVLVGAMDEVRSLPQFKALRFPERVHFLGFQADPASILPLMDCAVTPTKYVEGFPKSAVEAMCLEVPVIVTAVGGLKELVRHEKDGLVVEPCKPTALALSIQRLLDDRSLCKRLAHAGKERVIESFPIEESIQKTLSWYQSFVSPTIIKL